MKKLVSILCCVVLTSLLLAQTKIVILPPCDNGRNVIEDYEKEELREELVKSIKALGNEAIINSEVDQYLNDPDFINSCDLTDYTIYKLSTLVSAEYLLVTHLEKNDNTLIFSARLIDSNTAYSSNTVISKGKIVRNQLPSLSGISKSLVQQLFAPEKESEEDTQKQISNGNQVQMSIEELIQLAKAMQGQGEKNSVINASLGQVVTFPDGSRGLCFYLDKQGHGLAISLDQVEMKWDDNRGRKIQDIVAIPNKDNLGEFLPGLGLTYTNAILSQVSQMDVPAASWCRMHGQDWYLPSAEEMRYLLVEANEKKGSKGKISKSLVQFGGVELDERWYWSSSECERDEALEVGLTGKISSEEKKEDLPVRAMRAF